jgi:hypothetical protein
MNSNHLIRGIYGLSSLVSPYLSCLAGLEENGHSRDGIFNLDSFAKVQRMKALLSLQTSGGNFQFSFQSQTGFTNTVYYRTNLATGSWLTWTNIPGDGSSKTSSIPLSLFSPSKTVFIRVSTQ